jgi:hypothetical protein
MLRLLLSTCKGETVLIWAAILSALLVVTASCGDLQDPASEAPSQSGLSEAELINPSAEGAQGNTPEQKQNGQSTPGTDWAAFALLAAQSPGETRPVTLGWDPSSSEGVLGYKVHLIAVSTAVEHIIDVGPATSLAVPLKIGESYGFTVTAYNSSMESQALPYMLFQVF